jgi:hypothetical protein
MERRFLEDLRDAFVAVCLLGLTVAGLYRLIIGELPWTFFLGEAIGLGLGIGLLMVASPRRRQP